MKECTLKKYERLYLRSELTMLFAQKQAFLVYPFRVVYHISRFDIGERGEEKALNGEMDNTPSFILSSNNAPVSGGGSPILSNREPVSEQHDSEIGKKLTKQTNARHRRMQQPRVSIVINVSKKRFKHAVDRNLLKRRTREAYRLQKNDLTAITESRGLTLFIGFQFVGHSMPPFALVNKAVAKSLNRLVEYVRSFEL